MTRIAYHIPIFGMPYEFLTTRSVRHSAPGSIAQFLAISAGKIGIHQYLGSAGMKMPLRHYIEIGIEESRNLRAVLGTQPPRRPPTAFVALGIGSIYVNRARDFLQSNTGLYSDSLPL